MEIEDKVHVKLSKKDVEEIVKQHFLQNGIKLNLINFNVRSRPDDNSEYSSYQFADAICEGVRVPTTKRGGGLEIA
jgi:hypothetical protein